MPNYDSQISPEEVSGMVGKMQGMTQQLLTAMGTMESRLGRMLSSYGQVANKMQGMSEASKTLLDLQSRMATAIEKQHQAAEKLTKTNQDIKKVTEQQKKVEEQINALRDKGRFTRGSAEKQKELAVLSKEVRELKEKEQVLRKVYQAEDQAAKAAGKQAAGLRRAGVRPGAAGGGGGRPDIGMRRNRYGVFSDALDVASDLNLPGVGTASTIGKYASRSVEAARARAEEQGTDPEKFSPLLRAGLKGGAIGAGIAAGGYTALQGYRAYSTAHEMAPLRRTLAGQLGRGAAGIAAGAAGDEGMLRMGYGGMENLQALSQMRRSMGSGSVGTLRTLTDASKTFGLSREETIGQAGALKLASGAGATASAKNLEKIMVEGVKGGMDRARITEYTQQVIGIQQDVLQSTGKDRTGSISQALASMMKMSGRGEGFLHGPEMGAIRGLNQGMGGILGGGPASGTIMRAMGFGAGGKNQFGNNFGQMLRTMDEGVFGGGGKGGDPLSRIRKIAGQFVKESGGDKEAAKIRMRTELGIKMGQSDALFSMLGKKPGDLSKGDRQQLDKMREESKDPMDRLNEVTARQSAAMVKAADDLLPTIIGIDSTLLKTQEAALDELKKIAGVFGGTSGSPGGVTGTIKSATSAIGSVAAPGLSDTMGGWLDSAGQAGARLGNWIKGRKDDAGMAPQAGGSAPPARQTGAAGDDAATTDNTRATRELTDIIKKFKPGGPAGAPGGATRVTRTVR